MEGFFCAFKTNKKCDKFDGRMIRFKGLETLKPKILNVDVIVLLFLRTMEKTRK